jgi:hypothetical protein
MLGLLDWSDPIHSDIASKSNVKQQESRELSATIFSFP